MQIFLVLICTYVKMELNCVKTCKNKTKLSEAMKKYPCLFKLFL